MPIYSILVDETGKRLHLAKPLVRPSEGKILVVENQHRINGYWANSKITTQTTTTLVPAVPGSAIILTDLIVNVDRTANLTLVIRFGDGVNTEVLFEPDVNNLQFNVAFSPQGRFGGWKSADLQAVTGGANGNISITVGCYHITEADSYSEWISKRSRAQGI